MPDIDNLSWAGLYWKDEVKLWPIIRGTDRSTYCTSSKGQPLLILRVNCPCSLALLCPLRCTVLLPTQIHYCKRGCLSQRHHGLDWRVTHWTVGPVQVCTWLHKLSQCNGWFPVFLPQDTFMTHGNVIQHTCHTESSDCLCAVANCWVLLDVSKHCCCILKFDFRRRPDLTCTQHFLDVHTLCPI